MKYRLVDYQTVSISKNKISLHSQIPKSQMKDKLFHIFLLVECLKHRPQMNGYSNDDFFLSYFIPLLPEYKNRSIYNANQLNRFYISVHWPYMGYVEKIQEQLLRYKKNE